MSLKHNVGFSAVRRGFCARVAVIALVAGLQALCASGAVITESMTSTPNVSIPDASFVGISHTISFPASIASITEVTLELDVAGGFTGDLYAYLEHDSGFSVLLNRTGRTGNSGEASLGYLDGGFDITLQDAAANGDIHDYRSTSNPGGGILTGIWQPDARAVSPLTVNGSEARDATLSSFAGLASGGDWTLYFADLSGGGISVLQEWTLHVSGVAVPEPVTVAGFSAVGLLAWVAVREFRRRQARL